MNRICLGVVFLSYILTAYCAVYVSAGSESLALVWPSSGIALAAVVLGGPRFSIVVALAAYTVSYGIGLPAIASFGIAMGAGLESWLGGKFLTRYRKIDKSFSGLRDVGWFLIGAAFLGPLVNAASSVLSLYFVNSISVVDVVPIFVRWWLANSLGIVIVTPAIFMWVTRRAHYVINRGKIIEFICFLFATLGVSVFLFADLSIWGVWDPLLFRRTYAILPLVLWAALSFGPRGSTFLSIILMLAAFWSLSFGSLAVVGQDLAVVYPLQIFIMTISCSGLILSSVIVQYERSEAKFKSMFDGTSVPMAQVSPDGSFILVNAGMCELTGYSRDELLGKKFSEITHPDDRLTDLDKFADLISGKNKAFYSEKRYIRKDGSVVPITVDATLIRDEIGKGLYTVAVIRDVSKQMSAVKESERAFALAESASRAKSVFLASMSHEIRTPLGVILGFADLLSDDSVSEARKAEFIRTIKRNAMDLGRLIDDILDLSKVESGKLELNLESIPLAVFARGIEDTFGPIAAAKGIRFEMTVDSDVPLKVISDQKRLRQILVNLIGNAVKFTTRGVVSLRVMMAADHSGKLAFVVRDTGCGISATEAQDLFRPFTQASSVTSKNYGGTGLGLVLSKKLANMLGGDVVLESSEPDKGSTFVATFESGQSDEVSAKPAVSLDAEAISRAESAGVRGLKILVAEDTPDQAMLIKILLQARGVDVDFAINGLEAIEKAIATSYDAILMDVQMPVLDGLEATRRLRACGVSTPIIALTAQAMSDDRRRCLDAGCTSHLSKPFTGDGLVSAIAAVLARA